MSSEISRLLDENHGLQQRVDELESEIDLRGKMLAEYASMQAENERLKAAIRELTDALEALVDLKELKDNYGKPENYEELKTKLWPKARRVLNRTHQPDSVETREE